MDLYRQLILDHYKHPRNFGHLDGMDVKSEELNPSCGDRVGIEIKVKVNSQVPMVIDDIRFYGEGCAIDQASASMLTEKVKGMPVDDVQKLQLSDIESLLGTTLTPSRVKCALLPLEVIQKAIRNE